MNLATNLQKRNCPVCDAGVDQADLFLASSIDTGKMTAQSFASRKQPEFMSYKLVKCRICTVVYACETPSSGDVAAAYHRADFSSRDEADQAAQTYRDVLAPAIASLKHHDIALEVGTGTGAFLAHLKQFGFAAVAGIGPSPAAIAQADPAVRPMICEGIFTGEEFVPGTASLICCFQTLEHLPDPRAFVAAAWRMLAPGGILALVTHDYTASLNRLLDKRSPIIDIEHMQLFNPQSLRILTEGGGYKLVALRPIKNTYRLSYWLSLLPLPRGIKRAFLAVLKASGLGRVLLSCAVGNLLTIAQKPE